MTVSTGIGRPKRWENQDLGGEPGERSAAEAHPTIEPEVVPGRSDRIPPTVLVVPAVVLSAVFGWYWWQLGDTFQLPDYGDLWRMSYFYSADGSISFPELFREGETFGHIPFTQVVLNHLAITRADYRLLWGPGAVASVLTGLVVAAAYWIGVTERSRNRPEVLISAIAGVLAVRFDVQNIVVNSLVTYSQVFYLTAIVGIIVASLPRGRSDGVLRQFGGPIGVAVGFLVVAGEAPAATLGLVMMAFAVIAGVVGPRPLRRRALSLGASALAGFAVRWFLLRVTGAEGHALPLSPVGIGEILAGAMGLVGAGMVDLTTVWEASSEAHDRAYVLIGTVATVLWSVVGVRILAIRKPSPVDTTLGIGVILAVGFVLLNALAISAVRGLTPSYYHSRAVRSTALAAPLVLAALHLLISNRRQQMSRWLLAVPLALGVGLLAVRTAQAVDLMERIAANPNYRGGRAVAVCADPPTVETWQRLWPGFDEERIDVLLTNEEFELRQRAGCDEVRP